MTRALDEVDGSGDALDSTPDSVAGQRTHAAVPAVSLPSDAEQRMWAAHVMSVLSSLHHQSSHHKRRAYSPYASSTRQHMTCLAARRLQLAEVLMEQVHDGSWPAGLPCARPKGRQTSSEPKGTTTLKQTRTARTSKMPRHSPPVYPLEILANPARSSAAADRDHPPWRYLEQWATVRLLWHVLRHFAGDGLLSWHAQNP